MSWKQSTEYRVNSSFNIALKDDFMFFVWDDVDSQAYNCFIENKNDLTFSPHPSFTNNFETPLYQNTRYLLGTTTEGKEVELNLCFYSITLEEFNKVLANWLQIGKTALFQYEYNEYYGYNCRIKSIGAAKKYVLSNSENGYNYIIEVSVSFETIEDSYAICRYFTNLKSNVDIVTDSSISPSTFTTWTFFSDIVFYNPSSNSNEVTIKSSSLHFFYNSDGINYDEKKTFYWTCFTVNNMGYLDCPFDLIFNGLKGNQEVLTYLSTSEFQYIINSDKTNKDYSYIDTLSSIAHFKINPEVSDLNLPLKYSSNLGLISIANQPVNMTLINSKEPLIYNICKANQVLKPGPNYILILINPYHLEGEIGTLKTSFSINLSFRKRAVVI